MIKKPRWEKQERQARRKKEKENTILLYKPSHVRDNYRGRTLDEVYNPSSIDTDSAMPIKASKMRGKWFFSLQQMRGAKLS